MKMKFVVDILPVYVVPYRCRDSSAERRTSMGQTDSQFKAFIRFVLDDIIEMQNEDDAEKIKEKLAKIADNLQKTLED